MDDQEFDLDSPADGHDESNHAFDWGEDEPSEGEEPDVLRFGLGGLAFAVAAEHVVEVATAPTITDVPGLPDYVVGVAVRRRHVLSILDLAVFLGLTHRSARSDRLLVLDAGGIEAGVVVSTISGLEVWPEDMESPSLNNLKGEIRKYVLSARWAPGGRVLLLDIPELLRDAAVR